MPNSFIQLNSEAHIFNNVNYAHLKMLFSELKKIILTAVTLSKSFFILKKHWFSNQDKKYLNINGVSKGKLQNLSLKSWWPTENLLVAKTITIAHAHRDHLNSWKKRQFSEKKRFSNNKQVA